MEAAGFVLYSCLFLPVGLIAKGTLKPREIVEHVFSDRAPIVVRWFLIISDLTRLPLRSGVKLTLRSLDSQF